MTEEQLKLKSEFISLLKSTERENMDKVIANLEQLGFFEAPASTRFHLSEEGGLLKHSMNVCRVGLMLFKQMSEMCPEIKETVSDSNVIIATLLHDVCKSDIYKKGVKYTKSVEGKWEPYEVYETDYSNLPLGHGEKSVIMLLSWGLQMTREEMSAIRWHMNAWEINFQSAESKGYYNAAKTPLLSIVQSADNLSAGILEYK